MTPANEQERTHVKERAAEVQEAPQQSGKIAFVDPGYTGEQAAEDARASGIEWIVVKLVEAKKGFVLLPKRWVVEHSFAWTARVRRLVRDVERTPEILKGLHDLACAILMLPQFVRTIAHLL